MCSKYEIRVELLNEIFRHSFPYYRVTRSMGKYWILTGNAKSQNQIIERNSIAEFKTREKGVLNDSELTMKA